MYNLKFFSAMQRHGEVPSYRAMEAVSYEVSPPSLTEPGSLVWADIVLHLPDGDPHLVQLRLGEYLIIENGNGKTIDRISEILAPLGAAQAR